MGMARIVTVVFGAIYLLTGLVGFVMGSPVFGLFEVNALHDIVHILIGAILLYGASTTPAAIMTLRAVGGLLLVLGLLGFVAPDGFGLVPLGGNDIWLHLVSAAILLGATFMGETADARTTV